MDIALEKEICDVAIIVVGWILTGCVLASIIIYIFGGDEG